MENVMFPVGRMIGGSVYKSYPKKDQLGTQVIGKDGNPVSEFSFGVAIPKGAEQHWVQTVWGKTIWNVGVAAYPKLVNLPTFSWKIKDGDSDVPNSVGRLTRDQEGCAKHWVIWFKQQWAPKLVTDKGATQLIEPDALVPGYYVEVYGSVAPNVIKPGVQGGRPGVYLNPIAVNRVAYGERIVNSDVDTSNVGFGSSPLPAGASLTPIGGGFNPQPQSPMHVGQYADQMMPPLPQPTPVAPNLAFLQVPPPPVQPKHVMTPAASGATYESMIAAGWNDQLLVQHGMML